jgi:cell division transport system ATP-binding protein
MIQFEHVSYLYDGAQKSAVADVTFGLEPGSFHFLTGASGAGKTTLFRLMYLDLLPTGGELRVFGQSAHALDRDGIAALRRQMGIVFQDFRLLPHLSVRENVALPLSLHGPLTPQQDADVTEILNWVGLGDQLHVTPAELSGGEKQRVAIARAVVTRPRLLIADEPTGNVDEAMGKRIMHLFTELNRHGTTVLIATHDRQLLKDFPLPTLFLDHGHLLRRVA